MCISQIINEKDLIFRGSVLLFLLEEEDGDEEIYKQSLIELIDQKVIEIYVDDYYRVYSRELLTVMKKNYEQSSKRFKDSIKQKISSLGGNDIKGTVYDAMLTEANRCQTYETEEVIINKYINIIKARKCDLENRKRALINLITYLNATPLNIEKAIKIISENIYLFKNDVEVNKLYVQLLWRSEKDLKKDVCKLLIEFFERNDPLEKCNFELFSIATFYCTYNVLSDYNSQLNKNNYTLRKIFTNYGKILYERVDIIGYDKIDDGIIMIVLQALLMTLELTVTLAKKDYNMLQYSKKLWFFLSGKVKGELWEQHRKLDKSIKELYEIKIKEVKKCYNIDDIVYGKVFKIFKNKILISLDHSYKATVYIDKIANKYIQDINKEVTLGQYIKAKVIKIDDYSEICLDMRL